MVPLPIRINKAGSVFSWVIWRGYRIWQHRDDCHREDASHFIIMSIITSLDANKSGSSIIAWPYPFSLITFLISSHEIFWVAVSDWYINPLLSSHNSTITLSGFTFVIISRTCAFDALLEAILVIYGMYSIIKQEAFEGVSSRGLICMFFQL